MTNATSASGLFQTWVAVPDGRGGERLEARWVTAQPTSTSVPAAAAAA